MTNKTFCIDQTKSLVELYALKCDMEIAKMPDFQEIRRFSSKTIDFDEKTVFSLFPFHI